VRVSVVSVVGSGAASGAVSWRRQRRR
jgi:hypothetical protein